MIYRVSLKKTLFCDSCSTGGFGLLQGAGYQSKTLSIIFRAASSIGNTDFLSITNFWPKNGVDPIFLGIFLDIFISNFPKLLKLGYNWLLWSLNFKGITLQHDINRKQDLHVHCTFRSLKRCCVPRHCGEMSLKWHDL